MSLTKELKVTIVAYIDDAFPGWIRCCFYDAHENVHYITEKVPIITLADLTKQSEYPQNGYVRCSVVHTNDDVITIDVSHPFSIESESGQTVFEVFANQLEQ